MSYIVSVGLVIPKPFFEIFALVAKMTIVGTILAFVASQPQPFPQMNVKNVILHDDLKDEVYIRLLFGMPISLLTHVYKLKCSLNGLKQAPKNIQDLVQSSKLTSSTLMDTPMKINVKHGRDERKFLEDSALY